MLYLFTGNNRYLLQEEVKRWKQGFSDKYGAENISHITSLDARDIKALESEIFARSLLSEKRLILVEGFPFSSSDLPNGSSEIEEFFLGIIPKISEDTFLVFVSHAPDKRKKSYKDIEKQAQVKDFSLQNGVSVFQKLSGRYSDVITSDALQALIARKGGSYEKSLGEIEKLLITRKNISKNDITQFTTPEFEESIFAFIDTLLEKNNSRVISELHQLLMYSNLYALYNSIIANLRVFLYIEKLKNRGETLVGIEKHMKLGNRQFLLQKRYKSSFQDIQKLYENLLDFDSQMKTGQLVSSQEQDIYRAFERVFLQFLL